MDPAPKKLPWRMIGLAALVAAAAAALIFLDARALLLSGLARLEGFGVAGLAAIAVVYVFATVLAAPGSVLTIGAGFQAAVLWPGQPITALFAGYLTAAAGSIAGATLAFLLGRTLARPMVEKRVAANPKFQALDHAIGRTGLKMVFLVRLSPLFPFNLLNYALSLTQIRLRDYVLGSAVGMLPGTVLYVYIGTTAQSLTSAAAGGEGVSTAQTALIVAGLIATFAVVVVITRAASAALRGATGLENAE